LKGKRERVTKLDAARRQLRTAVRLFLQDGDTVSIHTLTGAAQEILRTLVARQAGAEPASFIHDSDWIKPEYVKEYRDLINAPRNFLKHANRDPDAVLEFYPDETMYWLLDCAQLYQRLTGRVLRDIWVFFLWCAVERPQILRSGTPFAAAVEQVRSRGYTSAAKRDFLVMLDRRDLWPWPSTD
jgi:hypothetical protein